MLLPQVGMGQCLSAANSVQTLLTTQDGTQDGKPAGLQSSSQALQLPPRRRRRRLPLPRLTPSPLCP